MSLEITTLTENARIEKEESKKITEEFRLNCLNLQEELSKKAEEIKRMVGEKERLVEETNALKFSFEQAESLLRVKEQEHSTFVSKLESEPLQRSDPTEIQELNSENENLQAELKKRQFLVSELVSDCMRLKTELAKEQSENELKQTELVSLRSRAQSLLAVKAQYESNENHLKSELADKDRVIHRQQEEVNAMRGDHQLLLQEFGVDSLPNLQILLNAYLDDIKALKSQVHIKDDGIESLQIAEKNLLQEKEDLIHKLLDLEAELDGAGKRLEGKENEVVNLLHKCSSLEENDFILQEELEDSRKQWEREKTQFLLQLDEEKEKCKEYQHLMEDYKLSIDQLETKVENLNQEATGSKTDNLRLEKLLEKREAELEEEKSRTTPLNKKIVQLKDEFLKENSAFRQILGGSHLPIVEETYQQSSIGDAEQCSALLSFVDKQLKELDAVLRRNIELNISESRIQHLEGQVNMANVKINEQASQVNVFVCYY